MVGASGLWGAEEVDEDRGSVQVALLRRAEDTGEDLLGVGAGLSRSVLIFSRQRLRALS